MPTPLPSFPHNVLWISFVPFSEMEPKKETRKKHQKRNSKKEPKKKQEKVQIQFEQAKGLSGQFYRSTLYQQSIRIKWRLLIFNILAKNQFAGFSKLLIFSGNVNLNVCKINLELDSENPSIRYSFVLSFNISKVVNLLIPHCLTLSMGHSKW
jgi:hypothetical protein